MYLTTYLISFLLPVIETVVAMVVVIAGGQRRLLASLVSLNSLDPIESPLSVPLAMILYVIPQISPSSVTTAIPLVIGAVPIYTYVYIHN